MVLRQGNCEQRGGGEIRAVVSMHVRHGRKHELREPGLEREGARGARCGVVQRRDGRECVQDVDVAVGERG